jgi:mono/diheme cytochrome c family protein
MHERNAMKRLATVAAAVAVASLVALSVPGIRPAAAAPAPKPAVDLAVKLKVSGGTTWGPVARISVKNQGTASQSGALLRVYAEHEGTTPLWSGTVDLAPGRSVVVSEPIWLESEASVLVADVVPAGSPDEHPADDAARAGLGKPGRPALVLVGRSVHLADCASCHGADAAGGTAPTLVGATSKEILARAAAGGDHAFPRLSKADAKNLSLFYKDPAAAVLPTLPEPPVGGWPTYEGSVKALLDDRCVNCHGPAIANRHIRLDTYAGAYRSASRSLVSVKLGRMPRSSKNFTAEETALLSNWILGGKRP